MGIAVYVKGVESLFFAQVFQESYPWIIPIFKTKTFLIVESIVIKNCILKEGV